MSRILKKNLKMFRCVVSVIRGGIRPLSSSYYNKTASICNNYRGFATLNRVCCNNSPMVPNLGLTNGSLVSIKQILDLSKNLAPVPTRTVTKFSIRKGKRKTVQAVVRRFFRLHWGAWIRPKVARKKKLWTKSPARKRRLRQHVFCTSTQTTLLDKMVTKFWKRPKYYVDDPYAPYHTREEFYLTRKQPLVRK